MTTEYAIIVKNKTRLEALTERFNTRAQARFYIERSGGVFEDYQLEHDTFHQALNVIQRQLSQCIKNKIVERNYLPSFLFDSSQLVVVVGQDGLVANAAKYVNGAPIIAINPDTRRYDGYLLPFNAKNFIGAVEKVINGKFTARSLAFAEASLNDGQRLLGFNDLFIGAATHISARYRISYHQNHEEHSSSGIIVSTQAGSTGWLSSVFNMSYGVRNFIEHVGTEKKAIKLEGDQLMFTVREPFQSKKTQTNIVAGILDGQNKLILESYMPTKGVIFSDGVESDFLHFNSGTIASIGIAKEQAVLVTAG
jgi:NAD kinase